MPRKIIYIMSLGHSGSTLLELLINRTFTGVTSLGEIHQTFVKRKQPQKTCTCGARKEQCPFWRHHDFQAADEFHQFYRSVAESTGAGCLTDSSKSLDVFRRYHLDRKEHFYVVFLRKDLVSYYRSAKKRGSREKTELARIVKHNPARIVLRWLYHNSRMHAFLNNNQVPHLSTTYEEVCNHTAAVMDQVAQLTGLQYEDSPHFKNVHALRGNRARFQFLRDAVVAPCDTRSRIPARQRWLTHVDDFFNRCLAR